MLPVGSLPSAICERIPDAMRLRVTVNSTIRSTISQSHIALPHSKTIRPLVFCRLQFVMGQSVPTDYRSLRGKIFTQLALLEANLYDHARFGVICGANSEKTRRSHNFFNFPPNGMQKEAR